MELYGMFSFVTDFFCSTFCLYDAQFILFNYRKISILKVWSEEPLVVGERGGP